MAEPLIIIGDSSQAVRETPEQRGMRQAYRDIDLLGSGGLWPSTYPTMTGPEAVAAAKKLWRKFAGRQWPGTWRIGRGNHRIYPRGSVMLVNPGLGWPRFIHDLSHALYDSALTAGTKTRLPHLYVKGERRPLLSKAVHDNYKTAKAGGHTQDHAILEKQMVQMVIDSGWLDGTLRKPAKASKPKTDMVEVGKPSQRERNEAKIDAGITRWTAKLKKAQKAVATAEKRLKELAGKKRYYDRQRSK